MEILLNTPVIDYAMFGQNSQKSGYRAQTSTRCWHLANPFLLTHSSVELPIRSVLVVQRAINAYLMRCNSSTKMFLLLNAVYSVKSEQRCIICSIISFFSHFSHICEWVAENQVMHRLRSQGEPLILAANVSCRYTLNIMWPSHTMLGPPKSSSRCSCPL